MRKLKKVGLIIVLATSFVCLCFSAIKYKEGSEPIKKIEKTTR